MSFRTIRYHCNWVSDLLFYKLNVVSAVLRQILIFLDAADIAFPARKRFQHRFCFLKNAGVREIVDFFSVYFVCCADRNLIQIAKYVKYGERYIGGDPLLVRQMLSQLS